MKNVLRLMCGWMAIALAACTGDELQQIAPLQKPVGERVINVDAYTPSDDAHTRLAFEDKGTEGLKLSWSEGDAFTAVIDNEAVTFSYDVDSKQFTATLPEGVTLTDGIVAYYPAYTDEYSTDLSEQTGALNSAKTFMEGTYHAASNSFTFAHSTAILKATFSGLPQDAEVASIKIGAAPYTISIPPTDDMNLAEGGIYIYLPNVAKDGNVVFSVSTTTGAVYTATQAVKLDEGIKVGTYYVAPIALTPAACNLPTGNDFNTALNSFLQGKELTQIKFIANSVNTDNSNPIGSSNAYMVANGNVLEIHTAAPKFVFNENSSSMFATLMTITAIDFGDDIDTSKVTDMSYMFSPCPKLTSLDLSNFDFSGVTDPAKFANMFTGLGADAANNPITIWVKDNATISKLNGVSTGINNSFAKYVSCEIARGERINEAIKAFPGSFSEIRFVANSSTTSESVIVGASNIYMVLKNNGVLELHTAAPKFVFKASCYGMFKQLRNIIAIDFGDNIDTSNVTNMSEMFFDCPILSSLDLSGFNTSNVTNMNSMFYHCSSLTSLNLSSFDTSNVTSMYGMFYECTELSSLDLSSFNFGSDTIFTLMFDSLGVFAAIKPILVYVKNENDKTLLESKSTGINDKYAQIVVKQP